VEVFLLYVHWGKSATTLSGLGGAAGSSLRGSFLTADGPDMYILDKPTTGLHLTITELLGCSAALVGPGQHGAIIDHNLDLIKQAGWIIDLGP